MFKYCKVRYWFQISRGFRLFASIEEDFKKKVDKNKNENVNIYSVYPPVNSWTYACRNGIHGCLI